MTDKTGITLATKGKYCSDNIMVTPDFNDDSLVLISEIVLTEDVSRVSVDIDEKYSNFDTLLLVLDVNLSNADWLYFAINSDISNTYTKKTNKISSQKSVCNKIGNNWNAVGNGAFNLQERTVGTGNLQKISFYTYTTGINILTGSTIKIYGKRVEYEDV